jgi:hypothetical protein
MFYLVLQLNGMAPIKYWIYTLIYDLIQTVEIPDTFVNTKCFLISYYSHRAYSYN